MNPSEDASEQVGTKLLFENERVRVWDLRLAPGESTGRHRHTNDYLYVVIGDGKLQALDEEGNERSNVEMKDGDVRFRTIEDEDVHEAVNVGTTPWRNIIVELK